MKQINRISVKDAAKLMNTSEQFIRQGMILGKLPIGAAVKMSSKWTFYISPEKFSEFTGIQI